MSSKSVTHRTKRESVEDDRIRKEAQALFAGIMARAIIRMSEEGDAQPGEEDEDEGTEEES